MTRTQYRISERMRFKEAYDGWQEGRLTREEAAQLLGVCERTFRRYVDRELTPISWTGDGPRRSTSWASPTTGPARGGALHGASQNPTSADDGQAQGVATGHAAVYARPGTQATGMVELGAARALCLLRHHRKLSEHRPIPHRSAADLAVRADAPGEPKPTVLGSIQCVGASLSSRPGENRSCLALPVGHIG